MMELSTLADLAFVKLELPLNKPVLAARRLTRKIEEREGVKEYKHTLLAY